MGGSGPRAIIEGMRRPFSVVIFAGLVALPLSGRAEDLTITSTVNTARGTHREQTQYVSASRMRLSDGERDTIVDLESGKVVLLDTRRKEYSETSLAEVRGFLDQMEAAMAGRTVFDRSIGSTASVTVTKNDDGGRTIAGHKTDKYTLTMGDAMRFEVWVAPDLAPPLQYFDARKAVYATMGPMARRYDRIFDELKKIKGFPLATASDSRMRVGRRQVTIEATEVRTGAISGAVFVVPPDYKRVESPFGGGRPPQPPQ
jgi:hypothetical protein